MLPTVKSGWYHGASQSFRPWAKGWRLFVFCRLLKTAASFVLGLKTFSAYPGAYVCGLAGRPF